MKKINLFISFMLFFINAYSQIDVNATYIEENCSLLFSITNQEDKTIVIADVPIVPVTNKIKISLYPQNGTEPYKDYYGNTLGAKDGSNLIILEPKESYNHTYVHLSSFKKGPYSKIEVSYVIMYGFYDIKDNNETKIVVGNKVINID